MAREKEIAHQRHLLTVGLIFTIPLFGLSMARDVVHQAMWHDFLPWLFNWPGLDWLFFALSTPVQFYVGWQYYVGAYKALRNKSANMDVLIAMGSSVAYLTAWSPLSARLFNRALGDHLYFETAAVIVALISLRGAPAARPVRSETDGPAGRNRARGARRSRSGHSGDEARRRRRHRAPRRRFCDGVVVGKSSVDESMSRASLPESAPGCHRRDRTGWADRFRRRKRRNRARADRPAGAGGAGSKAPVQKLADQVSVFIPAVIAIAARLSWLGSGVTSSAR
jgi:Cu+-exporting ATPase